MEYDAGLALTNAERFEALQAEQREKPRVGDLESVDTLVAEVQGGDPVFCTKAAELATRYTSMRRVRRDGSCFIRAYFYCCAEAAANDKAEAERVVRLLDDKKPQLKALGEHLEDFHDVIYELFSDVRDGKVSATTTPSLHDRFQDSLSDYVAYYGRFAASMYMQENAVLFEPFLDIDVKTYCQTQIETVGSEFEEPSIIALTNFFGVPVKIEYFDLTAGTACNSHRFPEEGTPKTFLLYRPGHYDVLYPKA
eukprot:TRINITY_DN74691_c0_g1_i1.p1 TRINITY_DN74691_c0_g1~~TRINITY_DN74691_c0_g1_i1.p1  ORF type:complete len:269 (+),score=106.93 TRINITY_DN74691_c0_g1_i1:52-807(+)